MTAALKMLRLKAATPRKPGRVRTNYVVGTGESLAQRIATLWAAFTTADELIEGAYDATEPGSSIEHLLDHVSHDLLVVAIEPMRKDCPSRADAEEAHKAMTATLAGLQGVIAMAAGSSIVPELQEGFELLDWFQRECQALALDGVLPASDLAAAPGLIGDTPQGPMDEAARILGCVIAMLEQMLQEMNSGAAYGAQTLLVRAEKAISDAIAGRTTRLQEEASEAMHEALDVLQLIAQKLDSPAVWGVFTLTELAKTKLDATVGCFGEAGQS